MLNLAASAENTASGNPVRLRDGIYNTAGVSQRCSGNKTALPAGGPGHTADSQIIPHDIDNRLNE